MDMRIQGSGENKTGRPHGLSVMNVRGACPADCKPSRSDELIMAVCLAGNVTLTMNENRYEVGRDMVWVKLPGVLYSADDMSPDFESYEFVVSRDFIKSMRFDLKSVASEMAYLSKVPTYRCDRRYVEDFMNWVRLAEGLSGSTGTHGDRTLQSIVASLIYFVSDLVESSRRAHSRNVDPALEIDRKYYYFMDFLALLSKHCATERSVRFYADKMYITPKYLSSVIKEVSGKTAGDWIEEFVVVEAKTMLQRTQNSVSEVAYKLNFSSISFFGKYFKRHTGMSPGDYRRTAPATA